MPIQCPRCNVPLSPRTAATAPGASPVTADFCSQCGGLWFDGAELGDVSPALGSLPKRSDEITRIASASAIHCPRCRGRLREVALVDVPIDVCADCSGVWLDGGEYEALSRAADAEEGLSPPPVPAERARPAAARAGTAKEVRCGKCGAMTPLDATYMTEKWLVCAACYLGGEREAMDERAHQGGSEFASQVREPSVYRPDVQLPPCVNGGGIVYGILSALLTSDRCPHCGCRSSSHCSH